MAILSAFFAWLGRQLSSIVQAILGWSVTALFGRLPSAKQTALSVALLVSLLWPILVLGVVFPAVSSWAFAMVPLNAWIGNAAVRWISVALAVALPWGIGALRGWHDEHVYLQPRPGEYDRVLAELARACAAAEVPVAVEPVPARLLVATRVLERLARSAVAPIVAEQP